MHPCQWWNPYVSIHYSPNSTTLAPQKLRVATQEDQGTYVSPRIQGEVHAALWCRLLWWCTLESLGGIDFIRLPLIIEVFVWITFEQSEELSGGVEVRTGGAQGPFDLETLTFRRRRCSVWENIIGIANITRLISRKRNCFIQAICTQQLHNISASTHHTRHK